MIDVEQFERELPKLPLADRERLKLLLEHSVEDELQARQKTFIYETMKRNMDEVGLTGNPEDLTLKQIDALHRAVIQKRVDDVEAGRAELIPWEEVENTLFSS